MPGSTKAPVPRAGMLSESGDERLEGFEMF